MESDSDADVLNYSSDFEETFQIVDLANSHCEQYGRFEK